MWIFLEGGRFLSLVADPNHGDMLLVRARLPGDIEVDFPDAKVQEHPLNEDEPSAYRYTAQVSRGAVLKAIAHELEDLHYSRFQQSVCNANRVWATQQCDAVMQQAQETARSGVQQHSLCYPPHLQE
ncbi:hypothetical protein Mmc1_1090 [Magnetococcus marinus MC-1]|uniref:Uncharacterized protein n=1 Tax=Magnetococcus marinus (strain ATCC BAA-1437 / JCM 17883 / MC-1) TaxID=156889 RepID=A0L6L5_MAGMM|nr:hypothetical protein [Magnetococcus marinus]ABK43608.1 hypothetical protein Mmc1_1090 [Magnetococcus marinus MC-1]